MNPKIREKTILKKKLLRTTMFSMAIFVALLFLGSAVAASFAGSNATLENNYEKQLGDPAGLAGVPHHIGSVESSPIPIRGDIFYAYNAYDPTMAVAEGPIYFDSDDPGSVTLLAPTTSPQFIAGGCWVEDEGWYGSQFGGGLWKIDEITGAMTLVGSHTQTLNGLTYCDATSTMYGSSGTDLYTVDMQTGATTLVGSHGISFTMIGIACDGQGNMYGTTVDFSAIANLYSIDMTTGAATVIGSTGLNLLYAQDMEYDKNNDVLYLAAYTSALGGQLYTCDTSTGATTLIGNFQGGMEVTGLAIEYVTTPPENDLALQSIIRPATGTGSVITPQVSIRNRGTTSAFNVPVDMNIGKWEYTTYFEEDFTGVAVGAIPTGWTKIPATTHWGVVNTALAGGVAPEMRFYWSPSATDKFQLQTPEIDTTGLTEVTFSFRHFLSHYSGPYTLQVVAIADGDTYIIEEWVNPTANIPAQLKEYTLTAAHGLGADDFQIVFVFDGNSFNTNNWNIDNVMLYQKEFIPEYEETIIVNVPAGETLEFDFPAWTPEDLGVAENVNIIYYCEAEIDYDDDNPDNNYRDKTFTLSFGYLYDIGVTDIPSPVSGVGGTQIPVATVENFGQFDVTGASVNMHIQENIAGGESLINQWVNPTGWGAQLVTYTLTDVDHGVGAENFQIAWVFDGNSYNTNNWNIDNIKVTGDGVTLYEEDFTGTPANQLPAGWTKTPETTHWNVQSSSSAGGTAPELRFYWSPSQTNRFYVITPYFDTSGYDEIELEFRHFLSHFSGAYNLEVVAIATEYMTVYDETVNFAIAAGEVMDITFPAWTPAAPFADVDYLVTACTSIDMVPEIEVFNEDFSVDPVDWTITHITGTAWTWSSINQRMENLYGWTEPNTGYLDSPIIDLSEKTGVGLSFWHLWKADYSMGEQHGYVRGSIDGGDTFPYLIAEFLDQTVDEGIKEYDISSWADDESEVVIRFDVYNDDNWYWYVDDVIITSLEGEAVEDGNPDNDCMSKMITLMYLHDVGTVEIIPFPGGRDKAMFDLQFSFDVEAASGALGNAGAGFDGTYFYSTRWASNLIHKYDINGVLIEQFSIPGVTGLRDIAFDGEYFWGGAAAGTIWQMDFNTKTLVSTITGGFQSRALAYDTDLDVLYVSNWADPVWVVNPTTGAIIDTINLGTATSTYGLAYDTYCAGGPYLWVFDQGAGGGSPQHVYQWDLAAGAFTGVQHNVAGDFPGTAGIAGGLFVTADFEPGYITLGGLLQGTPDMMFCYELCEGGPGPSGNMYEPGTYTPKAVIENFGTYTEVNFNVNAQILDSTGAVFWEDDFMVITPMNPGDTQLITFGDVTFEEIAAHEGAYSLVVETQLPEDEKPQNDKKTWNFIIDIYDDIPPETTHELTGVMGDNNWFVSDVTIILTAVDPWPYKAPVGVNNTYISFDGVDFELYVGPVVVSEDGVHEFWYYSDDYNGNVEDVNGPFEFKRDATPPTINLAVEGSGKTWTLIATVSDATSGVARVEFYVNDEYLGEVTSAPFEWQYTNAKKGDIAQAIVYDNAGNSKISNAVEPTVLVSSQTTPFVQALQRSII